MSTTLKQVNIRGKIYTLGKTKNHKNPKGKNVKLRRKSRERLPFTAFFVVLKGFLDPFKNSHKYHRSTDESKINKTTPNIPKTTPKILVTTLTLRNKSAIDGIIETEIKAIIKKANLRLKNKHPNSVAKDE